MTKIVAIEDDLNVLDNIVDTLEAVGFEIKPARSGQSGLNLVKREMPEVVICDIMMPGVSGLDVLRELRQDPATATIPVVFLTARTDRGDLRQGMELGAADYITKPYTQEELIAAINTQLKKQTEVAEKYQTKLTELRRNILYALPHEMRTPLNLILGFAEMLMVDSDQVRPDEINSRCASILDAGRRLHRVLENYLIYAQIEIIEADPRQVEALRNHVTTDAGKIIEEQVLKSAEKAGRQADLTVAALGKFPLKISSENLQKIVAELADNAFKFSEPGTKVLVRASQEGGFYRLLIRDYGRGMTPEQIANIDAYMQFERALYEQQGLGLGLTIAKRLVQIHGGQLSIKSHVKRGTLVSVKFVG
jgi:two-component system sensor histidine kinase/response regulator